LVQEPEHHNDPRGPETIFRCTSCDQVIGVRPDGSLWETITTIYGRPTTAQEHHDLADGQEKDKIFFSQLRLAAHYQTLSEHMHFVNGMMDAVERYKAEHPLPVSLWRRIKERI
jgi:hypothetical protein